MNIRYATVSALSCQLNMLSKHSKNKQITQTSPPESQKPVEEDAVANDWFSLCSDNGYTRSKQKTVQS